jgi:opacity protein-like surface antigen
MSRWLAALAAITAARAASADPTAPEPTAGEVIGDQGIGGDLGVATGGRVTPGGLRVGGHYLYQLSDQDWFDGGAAFTFGGGGAACFRDRTGAMVCDHGLTDGDGVEISATVRRYFEPNGMFRPFARVGIGVGLARFGGDSVSGFVIPLHAGGGLRAGVSDGIAVVAQAELEVGLGFYDKGLGTEPVVGGAVVVGAEFRLQ